MTDFKTQLEAKIQCVKDEIEEKARNLSVNMLLLAERVQKEKHINSLGEVQGQGKNIDVLCSQLSALQKQLGVYNSMLKVFQYGPMDC